MAATRHLTVVTIEYDANNDPTHVRLVSEVRIVDPDNNARIVTQNEINRVPIPDLTAPQQVTVGDLAGALFVPILNTINPL